MKTNKLLAIASAGLPRTVTKLSDGREVKIRAFAVKELKLLMMANTSETAQDVQVLQILDQCIETDGIEASMLPSHDVEKLYLDLYKISKGTSLVEVAYNCANVVDGKKCNNTIKTTVNLNTVVYENDIDKTIKLTNGLVMNMRYPNILEREYFEDKFDNLFNLAMRCIESVDTGTEVLKVGVDITPEELMEVMEYLDESSFETMLEFVSNLPSITTSFPLRCPCCGHEEVMTLRGLGDFFD